MSIELDKLGAGSVVEAATGSLFTKDDYGDWWQLSITLGSAPIKKLDYLKDGTVLREVKKGPLDDFVEGDVISFETNAKVRVASKIREDFWQVAGALSEFTSEELAGLADEGSVRKVGSLDGRG